MARHVGISPDSVHRLWKQNDLKPHLTRTFKLSRDPDFERKFWDVIGLYLNPPEKTLVLCCDEKSQCQALERTQAARTSDVPMFRRRRGAVEQVGEHGGSGLVASPSGPPWILEPVSKVVVRTSRRKP